MMLAQPKTDSYTRCLMRGRGPAQYVVKYATGEFRGEPNNYGKLVFEWRDKQDYALGPFRYSKTAEGVMIDLMGGPGVVTGSVELIEEPVTETIHTLV